MDGVLSAIGATPLVRLERLVDDTMAEVWVKLEGANPTGSYKDRMALAIIEGAEREGRLEPGQPIVEYTGGSTGSSLAFICSMRGYPLRLVTSDAFSAEKLRTMGAFGAELEIIPSDGGITAELLSSMRGRCEEIAAKTGAFNTDQFNNRDAIAGYRILGDEIVAELPGPAAAFCGLIGTAGNFLGVTAALRESRPELERIVIEPEESPVISGGASGKHRIEGGGVGFWPPMLSEGSYDRVETVSTSDAWDMARRAARTEGLWTGPSGGANLVVALRAATRLGPGHRVVTVQPDSGLKYVGGELYA